jgi:acyl carrier protein
MTREDVIREIYDALRRVNELRRPDDHLACAEETVLFGPGGGLDSLGLISLVMDVEQAVNARAGATLTLADERALALRYNPFRNVRSLADRVIELLREEGICPTDPSS